MASSRLSKFIKDFSAQIQENFLRASSELHHKEATEYGVDYQKKGHEDGEFGMPGFVPKQDHAEQGAASPAQGRHRKKRRLGYAPLVPHGLPLVKAVERESAKVYGSQVDNVDCFEQVSLLSPAADYAAEKLRNTRMPEPGNSSPIQPDLTDTQPTGIFRDVILASHARKHSKNV